MIEDFGYTLNDAGLLVASDEVMPDATDEYEEYLNNFNQYQASLREDTCKGIPSITKDGKYIIPFLCNYQKSHEDKASININCFLQRDNEERTTAVIGVFDSRDHDGGEEYRSWRMEEINNGLRHLCGLETYVSEGEVSRTYRDREFLLSSPRAKL